MSDSQKSNSEQRHGERRKGDSFDYEGAERRRVQRIKGIVVEFKIHSSANAPQGAFLRDMSSKGLSISVAEKFDLGALLNISIYLTDVPDPVAVDAEVRWIRISEYFKEAAKKHYDVGLKFCNVEEEEKKVLEKYIDQHKSET